MKFGSYGVILADPPWKYRVDKGHEGMAEAQYATMTDAEIQALQVDGIPVSEIGAPDSVLLMWTTWPKLDIGLATMKAWGYEYKAGMPWVKIHGTPQRGLFHDLMIKPFYGIGFWMRGASEPILVGKRGNATFPKEGDDLIGLLCDQMQHSRKPDNLHHYAEQFPGPYLELFARRKRDGWDCWGLEV